MTALRHMVRPRLLDPDRLQGYQRMRVENGVLYTSTSEACLTVWRLPTVNLDVASAAAKRRHRAQWGAFLDGLGHEITIIIRARRLRRLQAIYEVFEHGSDEAKGLAKWLQHHLGDSFDITSLQGMLSAFAGRIKLTPAQWTVVREGVKRYVPAKA